MTSSLLLPGKELWCSWGEWGEGASTCCFPYNPAQSLFPSWNSAGSYITGRSNTSQRDKKMGILLSIPRPWPPPQQGRGLCSDCCCINVLSSCLYSQCIFLACPALLIAASWRDRSQIAEAQQCLSQVTFPGIPGTERGRSFSSEAKAWLPHVWARLLLLPPLPLNWGLLIHRRWLMPTHGL